MAQQIGRIVLFPALWLAWVGCLYVWGTALAGEEGSSVTVGFAAFE